MSDFLEAGRVQMVPQRIGSVAPLATKLFPGVALQSMLGSTFASLLPKPGRCVQVRLREIEGARIVDARFAGGRGRDGATGVLQVAVERQGRIDLHTWSGLRASGSFELHELEEDVGAFDLNFVELDTGICVSIDAQGVLTLRKPGKSARRTIQDPAMAQARIFADGGTLLAGIGDELFQARLK